MANYTIELRSLIDPIDKGGMNLDIWENITLTEYAPGYNEYFKQKFAERFYFSEINDVPGAWLISLKYFCEVNNDRWNKLLATQDLEMNPLANYDKVQTQKRIVNSSSTSSNEGEINNDITNRDHPFSPSSVDNIYRTSSINNYSDSADSSKSNSNVEEVFEDRIVGNIGVMTFDQILSGYRRAIITILDQIFDEIRRELFYYIY